MFKRPRAVWDVLPPSSCGGWLTPCYGCLPSSLVGDGGGGGAVMGVSSDDSGWVCLGWRTNIAYASDLVPKGVASSMRALRSPVAAVVAGVVRARNSARSASEGS